MKKTMRILSVASLLMTGPAIAMAANDGGGVGSKGRDRHRDGKPADEYAGDWYRTGCDIHPNRADLPSDRRPDWVDAA